MDVKFGEQSTHPHQFLAQNVGKSPGCWFQSAVTDAGELGKQLGIELGILTAPPRPCWRSIPTTQPARNHTLEEESPQLVAGSSCKLSGGGGYRIAATNSSFPRSG